MWWILVTRIRENSYTEYCWQIYFLIKDTYFLTIMNKLALTGALMNEGKQYQNYEWKIRQSESLWFATFGALIVYNLQIMLPCSAPFYWEMQTVAAIEETGATVNSVYWTWLARYCGGRVFYDIPRWYSQVIWYSPGIFPGDILIGGSPVGGSSTNNYVNTRVLFQCLLLPAHTIRNEKWKYQDISSCPVLVRDNRMRWDYTVALWLE